MKKKVIVRKRAYAFGFTFFLLPGVIFSMAFDNPANQITQLNTEKNVIPVEEEYQEPEYPITEEEINMIAQLTMAEADNQPEEGQRLVIDTVLNRMDHYAFPDTVYDVIYQKNQFSPILDGRFYECYPKENLVQLVKEELINRTNTEVVFFRAYNYGPYGVPLFKVGDHYFSKY